MASIRRGVIEAELVELARCSIPWNARPKNEGTLARGSLLEPRDDTPTLAEAGISTTTAQRFAFQTLTATGSVVSRWGSWLVKLVYESACLPTTFTSAWIAEDTGKHHAKNLGFA